jgi:hypothetical protein
MKSADCLEPYCVLQPQTTDEQPRHSSPAGSGVETDHESQQIPLTSAVVGESGVAKDVGLLADTMPAACAIYDGLARTALFDCGRLRENISKACVVLCLLLIAYVSRSQ